MYILTTISRDDLPRLAQIQRFLQMDRHGQYVIRQRGQSSLSPPRIGDRFKVKIDRTSFLWLQGERTRSKRGGARAEINHRCICSDPYGGGTQFPPTGDYYMVDSTLRKGDHGRFRSPYVSRQHNGNYVTPHSPYLEGGEPPLQGSATQLQYARDTTIFTPELQKALQIIITVLKVAIGVGSVVVTFGAGGDTVVKSIVATINSGLFYLNLIQVTTTLATQSTYLSDLLKINFVEGPEKVKQETLVIIQRMVSDGNEAQIDPICEILASMLSSIAMVVGDWISTFIPDDAGLVGVAVTTIINQVSKHAFSLLSSVFDKIPTIFQDLFKHPEK